jgi:hypothetical protein
LRSIFVQILFPNWMFNKNEWRRASPSLLLDLLVRRALLFLSIDWLTMRMDGVFSPKPEAIPFSILPSWFHSHPLNQFYNKKLADLLAKTGLKLKSQKEREMKEMRFHIRWLLAISGASFCNKKSPTDTAQQLN